MSFDKYSNQTNVTPTERKLFTGLNAIKILGINPTEKQLKEIIGDAAEKFNTAYDKTEDFNENTVRPVTIWVQDLGEEVSPIVFTINVNPNKGIISRNGNILHINDEIRSIYMTEQQIKDHPKMGWYNMRGFREAKIGEESLYQFISTILRWDFKGENSFLDMVKDLKLDLETIFNGDYSGLHKLVEYTNEKKFSMIVPFVVKQKETDDGIVTRQEILVNSDYWYRTSTGLVTNYMLDSFLNSHKKAIQEGRQITQKYYTASWTEFNKGLCLNPDVQVNTADLTSSDEPVSTSWLS